MRKLILALMLSVLLLGFGNAMAATSSIDNLPGGAGVAYFQVGNGWSTLLNIQNVADNATIACSGAILVHVVLYNPNSIEIVDFNVPLSQIDNWGASIALVGTDIVVTPQSCPATLPNGPGADPGCTVQSGPAVVGPDGVAVGYITTAITEIDCGAPPAWMTNFPGGNNDGNPWNDSNQSGSDVVAPNWIFARTAIINPTTGVGFALNARMIQGFHNIAAIAEMGLVDFTNTLTLPDAVCGIGIDWDGNGLPAIAPFVGTDDFGGIRIDTWELYATLIKDTDPAAGVSTADTIVTDGCVRGGRVNIMGAANSWYWARFNAVAGISDTTLITVAPAATGPGNIGSNTMTTAGTVYNDNELNASVNFTPIEAARCPYLTTTNVGTTACSTIAPNGIGHSTFTTGEHNFQFRNPMYGFSYTIAGNFADLYPIVPETIATVVTNLNGSAGNSFFDNVMVDLAFLSDYTSTWILVSDVAEWGAWQ